MFFITGNDVVNFDRGGDAFTESFSQVQLVRDAGATTTETVETESESRPREVLAGKCETTCCVGWSHMLSCTDDRVTIHGFSKGANVQKEISKDIRAVSVATSWVHTYVIDREGTCHVWKDSDFSGDGSGIRWQEADERDQLTCVSSGQSYTAICTEMGRAGLIVEESSGNYICRPLELRVCIRAVSCGQEHVMFLSSIGIVLTMGAASRGQTGHGGTESECEPRVVAALEGIRMVRISAGGWHSMAISVQLAPTKLVIIPGLTANLQSDPVSTRDSLTLAVIISHHRSEAEHKQIFHFLIDLTDIGDLYGWGWNESGQLGLPCRTIQQMNLSARIDSTPQQTAGGGSQQIQQTPPSTESSRQMETVNIQVIPRFIEVVHPDSGDEMTLTEVSCGSRHTAVITDDGELLTFGWNGYGQLGHGDRIDRDIPTPITSLDKWRIRHITCGSWTTLIEALPK